MKKNDTIHLKILVRIFSIILLCCVSTFSFSQEAAITIEVEDENAETTEGISDRILLDMNTGGEASLTPEQLLMLQESFRELGIELVVIEGDEYLTDDLAKAMEELFGAGDVIIQQESSDDLSNDE